MLGSTGSLADEKDRVHFSIASTIYTTFVVCALVTITAIDIGVKTSTIAIVVTIADSPPSGCLLA